MVMGILELIVLGGLALGAVAVAAVAIAVVFIVRAATRPGNQTRETELIQDMHDGMSDLAKRVEALETILLETTRKQTETSDEAH